MGRRATSAGNYGSPQAQLQHLKSQVFKWVGTELPNEVRLHSLRKAAKRIPPPLIVTLLSRV